MGTNFLFRFAFSLMRLTRPSCSLMMMSLILLLSQTLFAQIAAPSEPTPQIPPSRGERALDDDLKERHQRMDQKFIDAQIKAPPPPPPALIRGRKLLEQTLKPAPMRLVFNLHLVQGYFSSTATARENYSTEPSVGFGFLTRITGNDQDSSSALWIGYRHQFFGGTGRYLGVNGRFSFAYLGPTIAIGKIDPAIQDVGSDTFKSLESIEAANEARSAYFAATGISAQSRNGRHEETNDTPPEDFDEKLAFDSPGIWIELWYARIKYNALSYNFLVGAQTGSEKVFYYAGFGLGTWY